MAYGLPKNGQNREVPEAGRNIHLSLILALFWAHWAVNTLFWDLKTSIQDCFCVDLEHYYREAV